MILKKSVYIQKIHDYSNRIDVSHSLQNTYLRLNSRTPSRNTEYHQIYQKYIFVLHYQIHCNCSVNLYYNTLNKMNVYKIAEQFNKSNCRLLQSYYHFPMESQNSENEEHKCNLPNMQNFIPNVLKLCTNETKITKFNTTKDLRRRSYLQKSFVSRIEKKILVFSIQMNNYWTFL